MEQQTPTTEAAQRLARSVMQFNKVFMHFHRNDLRHAFTGCTPGSVGVLFIVRERNRSEAREVQVSEAHKLIKVSEISELMHVTSPTVTQFIKDLEANGLVERHIDPLDRRAVGIALTKRGEEIACRIENLFAESFQGLVEYLGEEQSNQLAGLLSKALRYFSEKDASAHQLYVHQSQWNGDEKV